MPIQSVFAICSLVRPAASNARTYRANLVAVANIDRALGSVEIDVLTARDLLQERPQCVTTAEGFMSLDDDAGP
jgi:hypothetical protein